MYNRLTDWLAGYLEDRLYSLQHDKKESDNDTCIHGTTCQTFSCKRIPIESIVVEVEWPHQHELYRFQHDSNVDYLWEWYESCLCLSSPSPRFFLQCVTQDFWKRFRNLTARIRSHWKYLQIQADNSYRLMTPFILI